MFPELSSDLCFNYRQQSHLDIQLTWERCWENCLQSALPNFYPRLCLSSQETQPGREDSQPFGQRWTNWGSPWSQPRLAKQKWNKTNKQTKMEKGLQPWGWRWKNWDSPSSRPGVAKRLGSPTAAWSDIGLTNGKNPVTKIDTGVVVLEKLSPPHRHLLSTVEEGGPPGWLRVSLNSRILSATELRSREGGMQSE